MATTVHFYLRDNAELGKRKPSQKDKLLTKDEKKEKRERLKERRKKGTPLSLHLHTKNKVWKYSTGEKVAPKDWSFDRERLKRGSSVDNMMEFNNWLNDLERMSKEVYFQLQKDKRLNIDNWRYEVGMAIGKIKKEKDSTFLDFMENSIKTKNGEPRTIKNLKTVYSNIKDYIKIRRRNKPLNWEDVDLNFKNDFESYLKNVRKHSNNYRSKHINVIKQFMNEGYDEGLHDNLKFRSTKFRIKLVKVPTTYLDEVEIKKLENFDFSHCERLERTRDWFLIGYYTGQRFSDFKNIKYSDIEVYDGAKVIRLTQKKGKNKVTIPVLFDNLERLLKKYENYKPISSQKFNKYIKEVCKITGIVSKWEYDKQETRPKETYEDGKVEKWEIVSAHTTRRSFITNMRGKETLSDKDIASISGHKDMRVFDEYDRLENDKRAKRIADKFKYSKTSLRAVK